MERLSERNGRRARLLWAGAIALSLAAPCWAQTKPAEPPELADPVLSLLEAPYLTDEERRDARVRHGVWRDSDLDTPGRRATAALIRGAIDDPVFYEPPANAEDWAEAALLRGDLERAIEIVKDASTLRAIRIRAEALEGLGRSADAAAALEPLVARLSSEKIGSADELVEGVRGLMIRALVRGQEQAAGGDFKTMLGLLARARTELDRLCWPAHLAEAELLYSKDNRKEAGDAAMQTLSLNPRSARAWSMLARAAVDGFNFEGVEGVAERLRRLSDPRISIDAGIALARARLRQNDPDGAAEAIAPALERFPRSRALLAVRAAVEAQRFDFERVDALLAEFDAISPGSYLGYYEVGRTLSENRQYESSARYLEEAARRAPHRAEPLIELGLMLVQAGRDKDAGTALAKACALDPFNTRAGNSLKLVQDLEQHATVESGHFIVRYRPGSDSVLADEMPALLEAMHDRVTGNGPGGIDHEPRTKTVIDLMPDHRAFAVRIAGITRIHTMAAATGPVIAMESPREGAGHTVGPYDWLRVVRHEYTHTVTLSRTNNRIPHWFTEAAAVYLEDSPRDYSACQLLEGALSADELFDLESINLGFVRPRRPQDRSLAYAQGHWMYSYIVERWGERAPLKLMDLYAAGQRERQAFPAVLKIAPDEFLRDFKAWARTQVASWGMGPRPGEPAIGLLLLEEAAKTDAERAGIREQLDAAADRAAWGAIVGGSEGATWDIALPKPTQEMIDRWLESYPKNPDILEIAVTTALRASGGEPTTAMIPLLERYAAARPVDPMPHKLLAKLYLGSKSTEAGAGPDAAIPHLEYLDAREQHSAAYAVELARRYASLKDWPRASEKARRATIVAPFDAGFREFAATIAMQTQDYETAERHILALTVLEPDREVHGRRLEALRRLMAARGG